MASRNLNGGIDGGVLARCDADQEVAACDALPPRLRALIKGSFVNTMATTVLAQWRELEAQGVPLAAYTDWFAQRLIVNQARACRATYGDGHPGSAIPAQPHNLSKNTRGSGVDADRDRAARRAAEISLDDV